MIISLFDLFSVGIGPSSSHTVGPMRAALRFAQELQRKSLLDKTTRVRIELFGSLGLTGKAHGSKKAVCLGLLGEHPESVDVSSIPERMRAIERKNRISLLGRYSIPLSMEEDLIFNRKESLPLHPNGMKFEAFGNDGAQILDKVYYSVGGGFIHNADGRSADETPELPPHYFNSAAELLEHCTHRKKTISEIVMENETAWRSEKEIRAYIDLLWSTMQQCVEAGCQNEGILPGGLKVKRRAPDKFKQLRSGSEEEDASNHLIALDWVNLFAIAVNEENAAGGRIVTAPTNGAAGVIPAVLHYYMKFLDGDRDGIHRFFLSATAIGTLFKMNASISGAEVGCQGEIGVACSMAAGGLAEVMGGTPAQVENAAEIGMEHNLGLTCDPVGGLVQVPCIERNAMGAVKAINAAQLALRGDGTHFVHLDKVIKTMRDTGADMKAKYKETSRGGLAVNVIEC